MFGRKRSDEDLIYADPTAHHKPAKPRRRKLWAIAAALTAVVLVLMAVAALGFTIQGKGQRYQDALRLLSEEQYDAAAAELARLDDFRDSADLLESIQDQECRYADALGLMAQEQYADAIAAFEGLGDFADAPAMVDQCLAAWATQLLEAGDEEGARSCLDKMSKDAYQEFIDAASGA